jgi:uncharacterized protein YebE (UPF0316 family)
MHSVNLSINPTIVVTFVLIVLARITDVTLDTLRTVAIVQGRRLFSAVLGFFQALIYICAIAKVLLNTDQPVYAFAYALGFALGTFLGITIEQHLAFGQQLASLFTRKGVELAKGLVAAGYRVARVQGHIRDGEVAILYVEIPRKLGQKLIRDAGAIDESCFCVVNDVRQAGFAVNRTNSTSLIHSPHQQTATATNAGNPPVAERDVGR